MNTTSLENSPAVRPGANEPCWCGSGQKYKKCHRDPDERGASSAAAAPAQAATPLNVRLQVPGRVSPKRPVPAHIPRPDYAATGRPGFRRPGSDVRTPDVIARMRRACRAAALVMEEVAQHIKPGVTTDALDAVAHEAYIRLGGYPSTLNYHGFPKSMCTSVNEVICHGIPDDQPLHDGDIINIDITIFLDGVHGDCSATYPVGTASQTDERLMRVTRECLELGIGVVKPGVAIKEIGRVIEAHASKHGMGTVHAFCGHGIAEQFHTALQIPHFFDRAANTIIQPGMTFTIEPMITLGTIRGVEWANGWTVVTADGKRTAQYEHTLLVTDTGAEILTRVDAPV